MPQSTTHSNIVKTPIFLEGFEAPFKQAGIQSFIKLLNWFTGYGKTFTAAQFAVDLFLKHGIIPVFLAPLHSLVDGFVQDVRRQQKHDRFISTIHKAVSGVEESVPVYRLYSDDQLKNDKTFFAGVLLLLDWLTGNPSITRLMEADQRGSNKMDNPLSRQLKETRSRCMYCKESNFQNLPQESDAYRAQVAIYEKAADLALSMARRITLKIIRTEIQSRQHGSNIDYMAQPVVAVMVERLFPLQAFLDRPGIIVSTASKSATRQTVIHQEASTKGCVEETFPHIFRFIHDLNIPGSQVGRRIRPEEGCARVVTFADEEEDSYWFLFDQHKSIMNPEGRNDLNEVINEFAKYFDLRWPIAFEKGHRHQLAEKLYFHLHRIADVAPMVWNEYDKERIRTNASHIPDARRLDIFQSVFRDFDPVICDEFSRKELDEILNKLIISNDHDQKFSHFKVKAWALKRVREYIKTLPGGIENEYKTFKRVTELIFDKKYFEMSRSSFGEWMDQPGQTFFHNTVNVMCSDFFERTELRSATGNRTIRLLHHQGTLPKSAFTLQHYLHFVLVMARLLDRQAVPQEEIHFHQEDDDRYQNLKKFRRDVRELFKSKNDTLLSDEALAEELVDDDFIFSLTKNIVTLEESRRQAEEYNRVENISLTVCVTSLRESPEEDLRELLGRNNGVFLMSATGGLQAASSGAFNVERLQYYIQRMNGLLLPMSAVEEAIVQQQAATMRASRNRVVSVVDDATSAYQFPTSTAFSGLSRQFMDTLHVLGRTPSRLNRHKLSEIKAMVASLDRLLTTDLRSGLCLCHTIRGIQRCLQVLAERSTFVRQVDSTGFHFIVDPKMLPTYKEFGPCDEIVIILYQAARFRKVSSAQTGAYAQDDDLGQFNQELDDALDTTSRKVLLWTAYGSAGRGVNFVLRHAGTELDFALFYLVNAPYYTRHTRPAKRGFCIESFQAMVQTLRDQQPGALSTTRPELLYEYARNRWKILWNEHVIDVVRSVMQALGRVERRATSHMPRQEIYVDVEIGKYLTIGSRLEPAFRQRSSATQSAVFAAIDQHNEATTLFPTQAEHLRHRQDSLKAAGGFANYTQTLPRQFRHSQAARQEWEGLFSHNMFEKPTGYIKQLKKLGVPAQYYASLFLSVPDGVQLYAAPVLLAGRTTTCITDYRDGADLYDWVDMLAPPSLLPYLPLFKSLGRYRTGFSDPNAPGRVLVPQPWFVTDIMKGFLAEQVFEVFVERRFGITRGDASGTGLLRYLDPLGHPHEADLYQLFDFYFEISGNTLVAVDLKNWTRSTDQWQKEALEAAAHEKFRRLRALFPSKRLHVLYLNLYGAHQFRVDTPANGSIRFMSLYVQNGSQEKDGWIENANLASALLGT